MPLYCYAAETFTGLTEVILEHDARFDARAFELLVATAERAVIAERYPAAWSAAHVELEEEYARARALGDHDTADALGLEMRQPYTMAFGGFVEDVVAALITDHGFRRPTAVGVVRRDGATLIAGLQPCATCGHDRPMTVTSERRNLTPAWACVQCAS